jgi:hypothetical protein
VQPSNALKLRLLGVWIHVGVGEIPKYVTVVNILRLRLTIGKVVTKEERFNIGLASVHVSVFTIAFAAAAEIPSLGNFCGISMLN